MRQFSRRVEERDAHTRYLNLITYLEVNENTVKDVGSELVVNSYRLSGF